MNNDEMNKNEAAANNDQNGTEMWMSLEQYNGDPEFAKRAENEFLSSPYASEDGKDGVARRDFLKLMGASIALATTACVRRPVQHIIPYAQQPKELTHGIPNFYASSWFDGVEGYGTLVRTYDGRPVKMEGNPLHPMNKGGLTARAHAEIIALYDPDRLKGPVRNLQNKTRTNKESVSAKWEDLDTAIVDALGKGSVAILSSSLPSPSTRALIGDFSRSFGGARWVQYDSLPNDAVSEASRRSYGRAMVPSYRIDRARLVVSIDADFLGTYLSPAEFMKQWSVFRQPGAKMGRLVMFESQVSLTGLNADDRYRIKPSQQLDVVFSLINEVAKASKGAANVPAAAQAAVRSAADATRLGLKAEELAKIAAQLWENRGAGLVIAGGLPTQTAEAVELQVAINVLNSMLGNDGKTIDYDSSFETRRGSSTEVASLIKDMQAGKIKTLIIHNLNAAYVLPTSSGFKEALSKVGLVVYTGLRSDETGRFADYVLPAGTTLESWGDYEFRGGVYSIQQPTILPLHDSRSFEESLLAWTKKAKGAPARVAQAKDWYEFIRGVWKTEIQPKAAEGRGQSADDFWNTVLQKGVVDTAQRSERTSASRSVAASALSFKARTPASGLELVLFPTVQLADGRYANVSWLQELPDPVTKMVWDNYVMVSPMRARQAELKEGDVIDIKVGDKSLHAPVHIQPGLHDEVLALAVGYGRKEAGRVGKDVGINTYDLATFSAAGIQFAGQSATFAKTGKKYELVSTQIHHSMEGRQIVVETTNQAFMKEAGSGIHRHKIFSIWPDHQYNKHKWAMSVDLNTCTGCSACVVACQSENNIPVVGKRYVMEGREMHWIRIDRYYKGSAEEPEAVFQPMLCQHCENAPCETVCPVLATVHSDEGLNDMVYNRCVGTRYCANNCPYKVRRFNWFNFAKREAPLHMALNPEVTVRTRGVMEKCTFCVHRIRYTTGVVLNKKAGEKLKDGQIKTACQESCPSNAIVFGDLNDPESAVRKLFDSQRTYAVLEELNTQPRVRYMTRVRNAERAKGDSHGKGGGHAAAPEAKDLNHQQQHQGENV